MHNRPLHTQWCGLQDRSGAHIHLPILSEDELRASAIGAGLVLLGNSGVTVRCPGQHLHIRPDAPDDCIVTDECGLPRLRCQNLGCRYLCHQSDWAMRDLYVRELEEAESNGTPVIPEEALLTLRVTVAVFRTPEGKAWLRRFV
jgi:hypothetical protein